MPLVFNPEDEIILAVLARVIQMNTYSGFPVMMNLKGTRKDGLRCQGFRYPG